MGSASFLLGALINTLVFVVSDALQGLEIEFSARVSLMKGRISLGFRT